MTSDGIRSGKPVVVWACRSSCTRPIRAHSFNRSPPRTNASKNYRADQNGTSQLTNFLRVNSCWRLAIDIIAAHPQTTFIAAHMANDAEDLEQTAQWLDKYPNMVVELASRISELGRQPFTARDFLIKYQDRVLFGTDGPWPRSALQSLLALSRNSR